MYIQYIQYIKLKMEYEGYSFKDKKYVGFGPTDPLMVLTKDSKLGFTGKLTGVRGWVCGGIPSEGIICGLQTYYDEQDEKSAGPCAQLPLGDKISSTFKLGGGEYVLNLKGRNSEQGIRELIFGTGKRSYRIGVQQPGADILNVDGAFTLGIDGSRIHSLVYAICANYLIYIGAYFVPHTTLPILQIKYKYPINPKELKLPGIHYKEYGKYFKDTYKVDHYNYIVNNNKYHSKITGIVGYINTEKCVGLEIFYDGRSGGAYFTSKLKGEAREVGMTLSGEEYLTEIMGKGGNGSLRTITFVSSFGRWMSVGCSPKEADLEGATSFTLSYESAEVGKLPIYEVAWALGGTQFHNIGAYFYGRCPHTTTVYNPQPKSIANSANITTMQSGVAPPHKCILYKHFETYPNFHKITRIRAWENTKGNKYPVGIEIFYDGASGGTCMGSDKRGEMLREFLLEKEEYIKRIEGRRKGEALTQIMFVSSKKKSFAFGKEAGGEGFELYKEGYFVKDLDIGCGEYLQHITAHLQKYRSSVAPPPTGSLDPVSRAIFNYAYPLMSQHMPPPPVPPQLEPHPPPQNAMLPPDLIPPKHLIHPMIPPPEETKAPKPPYIPLPLQLPDELPEELPEEVPEVPPPIEPGPPIPVPLDNLEINDMEEMERELEKMKERLKELELEKDKDIDTLRSLGSMEYDIICPITMMRMKDPVVAADGRSYERLDIEKWFENHDTSPTTNQVLTSKVLLPNLQLKNIIQSLDK